MEVRYEYGFTQLSLRSRPDLWAVWRLGFWGLCEIPQVGEVESFGSQPKVQANPHHKLTQKHSQPQQVSQLPTVVYS